MAKPMTVAPYKFEHVIALGDAIGAVLMPPTEAVALERQPSFTGLTEDGEVVGCAGVVKIWKGRWVAWAHVSESLAPQYLPSIIREIRKFLQDLGPGRVEAVVIHGERDHVKFAKACGFNELEAEYMGKYFPDGRAGQMFARVS